MTTGLAGAVLVCSGCGKPMRVGSSGGSGGKRLFYGCARRSAEGPCPAPTNVSKDAADAFVDEVMVEEIEGDGLELLASARELEAARQAVARRHRRTARRGIACRAPSPTTSGARSTSSAAHAERHAADAYEQQLAHAADVDDLPARRGRLARAGPHSPASCRAVTDRRRRGCAAEYRSRYADVTKRFTVIGDRFTITTGEKRVAALSPRREVADGVMEAAVIVLQHLRQSGLQALADQLEDQVPGLVAVPLKPFEKPRRGGRVLPSGS